MCIRLHKLQNKGLHVRIYVRHIAKQTTASTSTLRISARLQIDGRRQITNYYLRVPGVEHVECRHDL